MKNKLLILATAFVGALLSSEISAQEVPTGIRIVSEARQILSENELLKQTMDKVYYEKMDKLKEKGYAMIKMKARELTEETSRDETLTTNIHTTLTFEEVDGKTFIVYTIPGNKIFFKVTSPNLAFGIGLGKTFDPEISIYYNITARFEVIQNGSAESIKVIYPKWTVYNMRHFVLHDKLLKASKGEIDFWVDYNVNWAITPLYLDLNEMADKLNEYITTAVINNPALQKEFELDENRQLEVKPDATQSKLVFHHKYSPKGIVNRNTSNKAADIAEKPKATSTNTIPVTTSASGINKPAAAATPVKKNVVHVKKN